MEIKYLSSYKLAICLSLQGYHSILRRSNQERKGSGKRARLSPHVLALDGALVGELETVQRAVQEVCVCVGQYKYRYTLLYAVLFFLRAGLYIYIVLSFVHQFWKEEQFLQEYHTRYLCLMVQ